MRQAFPVGVLNDISSLFDGSNQLRGQMDAANAGIAAEKMRTLKRQNDMLDYPNLAQTSALLAGFDQNQAQQYQDFNKNGGLARAQQVGANGVNMPRVRPWRRRRPCHHFTMRWLNKSLHAA